MPAAFRRSITRFTQQKFTVSAAVVVLNAQSEVLLLNHVLRPHSGWGLPGGFVDRGEQPEEAVRRELREETGIEMDNLRMLGVRVLARHVEILFAAASSGSAAVRSHEILELGWFSAASAPAGLPRVQHELIKKVLSGEI